MNMVFGITASFLAALTVWQNRRYLSNMTLPWKKTVNRKPSVKQQNTNKIGKLNLERPE
jgi:hypothetical protein